MSKNKRNKSNIKALNEKNSIEIKRRYLKGRSKFWKSEEAPFKWDDTFEKLMEYADHHIKSASFQKALKTLDLCGGEKILDFGASTCWASYAFSKMGCATVALDFDMSDTFGLLAGKKLIENTGVTFELVAGDCEQIPLKEGYFDIVFGSQVLHHAEDLNRMVSEVVRVTKGGGMVIVIGEPKRGFFQSEESLKKSHKAVPFGVNEHFPSYFQYVSAFKKAGLVDITISPYVNWDALKEMINQIDNSLKRIACKAVYISLSRLLPNRFLNEIYLILSNVSVTIVAKKNK